MSKRARGRKPLDPENRNSELLHVRVRPEVRRALERLAKRHKGTKGTVSREMLRAFDYWITNNTGRSRLHTEALARAIAVVAKLIEDRTGRNWLNDPYAGAALCSAVLFIALRFASTSDDPEIPPAIAEWAARMPPDLAEMYRRPGGFGDLTALQLINEIEHAARPSRVNNEWDVPIFLTEDEALLGKIGRDLGLNQKRSHANERTPTRAAERVRQLVRGARQARSGNR